mmetsp:Transcript_41269/g.124833  ORF Transcript_41269/g.124833 Transcript_41269/m.124833 type:complete len:197 (-) Transcript_41269:98-688(-)
MHPTAGFGYVLPKPSRACRAANAMYSTSLAVMTLSSRCSSPPDDDDDDIHRGDGTPRGRCNRGWIDELRPSGAEATDAALRRPKLDRRHPSSPEPSHFTTRLGRSVETKAEDKDDEDDDEEEEEEERVLPTAEEGAEEEAATTRRGRQDEAEAAAAHQQARRRRRAGDRVVAILAATKVACIRIIVVGTSISGVAE